jgi:hypothetical protein
MMKFTRLALVALFLYGGGALVGCGDDEVTNGGPSIDDFVGDWAASAATLDFVDPAFPTIDMIGIGASMDLTVNADGSYEITIDVPGAPAMVITGDFTLIDDNTFSITNDDEPGEDPLEGTYSITGDELDVTLPGTTLIDVDQDGTNDEATLAATFDAVS